MTRLEVIKTCKLFINGQFPRSESGRTLKVATPSGDVIAHISRASRKDLRDAVEAAHRAQPEWAGRSAYNRGQILYRMAEMIEGRREEFVHAIASTRPAAIRRVQRDRSKASIASTPAHEVNESIDRLIAFAGWSDKFAQVFGCQNPVNLPYYNFTIPEPTGVVATVVPDEPPLLALVSLLAPVIVSGNTTVVIVNDPHPLPAVVFGEVCATSDIPRGVVNILTTKRGELIEHIASHRELNAVSAANLTKMQQTDLEAGAAENLKRVRVIRRRQEEWCDADLCESPWEIEPFVEMKTIWHPSAT